MSTQERTRVPIVSDEDAAPLVVDAIKKLNPELRREPYRSKVNHAIDAYRAIIRWAITTRTPPRGWHRITYTQMGRMLYPDVESYSAGGKAKTSSIRRWLDVLEAAGLIEWRGVHGHYLEFRVCEVPDVCLGARPCSSAGSSSGRWQRLRETCQERQERRVAPWRRRSGRTGVGRLFFGPDEFGSSGAGGVGGPLRVPTPTLSSSEGQTRAPEPAAAADDAMDALDRACPPSARAALSALRCLLTEEGGSWPSGASPDPALPLEALSLALWEQSCPGQGPRASRATMAQIRRSGQQLDRLWGPGAAGRLALDTFGDVRQGVDHGGDLERVESMAWWARILKATARDAVAGYRRRRGTRANGRGQVDHRDGTWAPRGRR